MSACAVENAASVCSKLRSQSAPGARAGVGASAASHARCVTMIRRCLSCHTSSDVERARAGRRACLKGGGGGEGEAQHEPKKKSVPRMWNTIVKKPHLSRKISECSLMFFLTG